MKNNCGCGQTNMTIKGFAQGVTIGVAEKLLSICKEIQEFSLENVVQFNAKYGGKLELYIRSTDFGSGVEEDRVREISAILNSVKYKQIFNLYHIGELMGAKIGVGVIPPPPPPCEET